MCWLLLVFGGFYEFIFWFLLVIVGFSLQHRKLWFDTRYHSSKMALAGFRWFSLAALHWAWVFAGFFWLLLALFWGKLKNVGFYWQMLAFKKPTPTFTKKSQKPTITHEIQLSFLPGKKNQRIKTCRTQHTPHII